MLPISHERFSLLHGGKGILGEGPFDLGDGHFLAGGDHEEIGGVELSQLDGQLFESLDGIVVVFFRAVADLPGGQRHAVGQDISDPFPADDFFHEVEESVPAVGRKFRQVLIRQDAGFVELDGEGHDLRCRVGVESVLLGDAQDVVGEVQLLEGRHVVGVFSVAFVAEVSSVPAS